MKLLIELAGRLVEADNDDAVVATVFDDNPLDPDWNPAAAVAAAAEDRPVVLWSGSRGDSLFEAHPHTWGAPGWESLEAACRSLSPLLDEVDATVCFRPHARHVLSDAPSCQRFLRDHGDGPFGLALAPALMLEPSMLPELEDHLTRIFELVAARTRFLFLSDVVADLEASVCRPVPLGEGVLPRPHVLDLIDRHLAPEVPIVLLDGEIARQRAWLASGGGS